MFPQKKNTGRVAGGQQNVEERGNRERKPNQQQRLQALTEEIEKVKTELERVFVDETMQRDERIRLSNDLSIQMRGLIETYERISGPNTWFNFTDNERKALEEMNTVGSDLQSEIVKSRQVNVNKVEEYRQVNPRFIELWRSAEASTAAYYKCLELSSQKFDSLSKEEQTMFVQEISEPLNNAIAFQTANDALDILRKDPGFNRDMLTDRYVRCTLHAGNTQNACHVLFPVINVLRARLANNEINDANYSIAVNDLCLAYVKMKINELNSLMSAAGIMVDTVGMSDVPLIAKTIVKIFFIKATFASINSMLPDIHFAKMLSQNVFQVASNISPFVLLPYASRESLAKIQENIGKLIKFIIGPDEPEQPPVGGAAPNAPPLEKALISHLFDRVIHADRQTTQKLLMGSGGLKMPESPLDIMSVIKCIQYLIRWFGVGSMMAFKDGVGNINDLFSTVGSFFRTGIRQVPHRLTEAVWDAALERVSQRGTRTPVDDLLYADIRRFLQEPEQESVGHSALKEVLLNLDRTTLSEANVHVFTALNLQQYPDQPYRYVRPADDASTLAMGGQSESSQVIAKDVVEHANALGPFRDETGEIYMTNSTGGVDTLYTPAPGPSFSRQIFDYPPQAASGGNIQPPAAAESSAVRTRPRKNIGGSHTYKRSTSKHTKHKKSSGLKQKSKKNKRQSRRKLRRASSRKGRK